MSPYLKKKKKKICLVIGVKSKTMKKNMKRVKSVFAFFHVAWVETLEIDYITFLVKMY